MRDKSVQDDYWVSATAVEMFESCPRKWGFRYLDGIKAQNKHAEFGVKVHTHLENWLSKNVVPPTDKEGKVAQAMIPHLPPPQAVDPKNVEIELLMKFSGITFVGKVDLWMPPPKPIIYDHKSTRDLIWVKDPDTLHDDVQAALYAAWGLTKSGASAVDVQWTYGRTEKAAKVKVTRRTLTGNDIKPRMLKTIDTAREILLVHSSGLRAMDLPYDASACEAYGGCPHRDTCNLSVQERMSSIMSQAGKSAFLERLKASKQAAASAPEPAPAPAKGSTSAKGGGALAKIRDRKANGQAVNPPEAAAPPPPPPEPTPEPETATVAARRGGGRPAGSTNKPKETPLSEVWVQFCCARISRVEKVDPNIVPAFAKSVAEIADEMLLQYAERFAESEE